MTPLPTSNEVPTITVNRYFVFVHQSRSTKSNSKTKSSYHPTYLAFYSNSNSRRSNRQILSFVIIGDFLSQNCIKCIN